MKNSAHRLLIIDDEAGIRDFLSTVARDLGFDVRAVAAADEFFAALEDFDPTVMILDLNMPGRDGI